MSSDKPDSFDPRLDFFLKVLRAFHHCRLETVLLGNAAAMIHGAPVTTKDADFLFRDTPINRKKLKRVAAELEVSISQPFFPASEVFRLEGGVFDVDLMPSLPGHRFESFRSKAVEVEIGPHRIRVAPLELIIQLKEKANRPKDRAVLPVLRNTLKILKEMQRRKPPPPGV